MTVKLLLNKAGTVTHKCYMSSEQAHKAARKYNQDGYDIIIRSYPNKRERKEQGIKYGGYIDTPYNGEVSK